MQHLNLTLDSPAENIALDEALLDAAEAGELDANILRIWESSTYFVALGRSSDPNVEVHLDACKQDRVPVLRRSSGGGTILAGPGSLMYALVLDLQQYPALRAIDQAHAFVLQRISTMLSSEEINIDHAGTSDLVIQHKPEQLPHKVSGNAIRLKRNHILYHGTLLYNFDLRQIPRYLATPTRTPGYRNQRPHADFVTNLDCEQLVLIETLVQGWQASQSLLHWPQQRLSEIIQTKYTGNPTWVIHQPNS